LTVGILQQREARRADRIVFDRQHRGFDAMLLPAEINDADFLFVPAADAPGGRASIMIAPAGFLADFDQALLRLGLCNLSEMGERSVSRRRRQRPKCLYWHKIKNVPKSNLESGAINPAPSRVVSY